MSTSTTPVFQLCQSVTNGGDVGVVGDFRGDVGGDFRGGVGSTFEGISPNRVKKYAYYRNVKIPNHAGNSPHVAHAPYELFNHSNLCFDISCNVCLFAHSMIDHTVSCLSPSCMYSIGKYTCYKLYPTKVAMDMMLYRK